MNKSQQPPAPLPPGTYTNRPEYRQEGPTTATIVLLDALNTQIQDQLYAKQQFIKFLGTLRPDDRVAVYLLGTKLRVLNDFTNDSRRLLAAVAKYSGQIVAQTANSNPIPTWPSARLSTSRLTRATSTACSTISTPCWPSSPSLIAC
jgi:hypothetical protein